MSSLISSGTFLFQQILLYIFALSKLAKNKLTLRNQSFMYSAFFLFLSSYTLPGSDSRGQTEETLQ